MVNRRLSKVITYPISLAKQANFKFLDPEEQHVQEADEIYPIELPEETIRHIYSFFKEDDQCGFEVQFRISEHFDWFFGNGTIAQNQFDFRVTAAREITSALGIYSNSHS